MTRGPIKSADDSGGPSRTYVDTHYFLSLIFEDDADEAQHLFYTLRSPSYHVLVPQLVLGEITAKILEKSSSNDLSDRFQKYCSLFSDYNLDHSCLLGVDEDACLHVSKLRAIDDWLDPNDALILSQALADPHSKFFLTHDTKMLDNQKIVNDERELRDNSRRYTQLKIKDWSS